jgi:mycothiol synthase
MAEDLSTRPYEEADASTVANMMNAIDVASGAEPGFTGGEVRGYMKTWVRDIGTDSRLVFTTGGTLAAFGVVTPPPDGGTRADTFGGVHPDFVGRGIGRDLFAWQNRRAREIHHEVAPTREWYIEAGASTENARAIRLLERFGYQPVRYFFEMVADLASAAPHAPIPAGLRAVPYTAEWAHSLYEAHMEAFADHWGFQKRSYDMWSPGAIGSEDFRADLSRIALDGDDIAGYVLAYDNIEGRAYIGQVGTRRPWRKRGLASALLRESIEAARASGKSSVSLGVDADSPTGAVGVYERLGFETRHRFVAYRAPLA